MNRKAFQSCLYLSKFIGTWKYVIYTRLIVGTIADKHFCTFFFVWKHSPKLIFHFRDLKNLIVFENNFAMLIDVIVFFLFGWGQSLTRDDFHLLCFLRFIGSLSSSCKKKRRLYYTYIQIGILVTGMAQGLKIWVGKL